MACGLSLPAEECAIRHWCEALKKLNAHREPNLQWRADCPVPDCRSLRAVEYHVPAKGKHVQWNSFCGHHDMDAMRPYLAKLIGPCMPGGRAARAPIEHDDLIDLALSDMPPMTMRLMMLRLAGMGTPEALGRLGVRRENRSRVIAGLTGGASKRMQDRRS